MKSHWSLRSLDILKGFGDEHFLEISCSQDFQQKSKCDRLIFPLFT